MRKYFAAMLAILLFFTVVPTTQAAASDIKGHWAEKELTELVNKGIMGGYPGGLYLPDRDITRAEFAKLVVQTLKLAPIENPPTTVSDIPILKDLNPNDPSQWFYVDVIQAIQAGIITGFEDNTFRPNDKITREQMATMIMRAINARDIYSEPATLKFKDEAKVQPYAKEYVQRIVYLEIMNGMDKSNFAPLLPSTRAQVATVLIRMLNKIENKPEVVYTTYNLTLTEMINKQMAVAPQTDKYRNDPSYVAGEYITDIIEENGKKFGLITNTTVLNVREGPGTDFRMVGKLNSILEAPTKIEILNEVVNEKQETWYQTTYGPWKNAKDTDLSYYVDPSNFLPNTQEYFQFLLLSKRAGVTAAELNSKILTSSAGILEGKGQAFVDASKMYSINEIYLVSHSLLETGNGNSTLAKGVTVESMLERDAKGNPILDENGLPKTVPVEKKTVYNVFGIGAFDQCPNICGAERAYNEGWFTPEAAIIGGAKYISEAYINNATYKQDTLYKMRWNPGYHENPKPNLSPHQYATDIGWAAKQVTRIHQMYQLLDSYSLYYDVPVYK